MKNALLLCLLLGATILAAVNVGDPIQIRRQRTYLYEGPGTEFSVVDTLTRNTTYPVRTIEGNWYGIKPRKQDGYVSARSTSAPNDTKSMLDQYSGQQMAMSRFGMAAGVRGFAHSYSGKFKGDPDFAEKALMYRLSKSYYRQWQNDSRRLYGIKGHSKIKVPPYKAPSYPSEKEEGFGLGVASKVATLGGGIYNNEPWQNYINAVGNWVVQNSDAYDLPFKFFILDVPEANASAFPGGYVFITRGMLKSISTEAELACVLAHEIVHVTHYHGLMEADQRKEHIARDAMLDELDEAFPDDDHEFDQTEQDLEEMELQMYEDIFAGRLEKYEQEADQVGMIYAARAGYNPRALGTLLNRMAGNKSNNEHYTAQSINKRLDWTAKSTITEPGLVTNTERFTRMKAENPL